MTAPYSTWLIERVPSDRKGIDWIYERKQMLREGWDLMIVLTPDRREMVCLGYLPEGEGAPSGAPSPHG